VKVLYLIDGLGSGGAQRQLVTLVKGLDRAIVEPEVALYHPRHHFVPELERGAVPVHQLGVSGGRDPRVLVRLRRLILTGDFDIVHTYLTRPGILARVATIHRDRPRVVVSERSVSLGESRLVLALERIMAGRADAMIANADVVKEHVESLVHGWRGRIDVIPNGLDWTKATAEEERAAKQFRGDHLSSPAELLIGVIARVAEPKNPLLLLDALAGLPGEARERIKVVWVGACRDKAFGESVAARRSALNLESSIEFLDPVRNVKSIYLAVDGVVLPSSWEGFPNAVLEALGAARPVIATNVGDTARLVRSGETGWLVEPENPEALACAIQAFVSAGANEREKLGRAGLELVRGEYSAAKLVERTVHIYRRVLGEPLRGA